MSEYYINSDLGKQYVNSLGTAAGSAKSLSDGAVLVRKEDGSVGVYKNGQWMDAVVGGSQSTATPTATATETAQNGAVNIETPELDSATTTQETQQPVTTELDTAKQQEELLAQIKSAREKAKEATAAVTQGLYTIGTEAGMNYVNQLKNAGDTQLLTDGTTLRREEDGSYSAIKNGQTLKVNIDNDAISRDTLMNEAIRGAFEKENTYTVGTSAGVDLLQQAKATGSSVWANDGSEWSYNQNDGGFYATKNGQQSAITVNKDAIAQEAAKKKAEAEAANTYTIGTENGVKWADSRHNKGDMKAGSDGTVWVWNAPGDVTVIRNGQLLQATIDREAVSKDAAKIAAQAATGVSSGSATGVSTGGTSGSYSSGGYSSGYSSKSSSGSGASATSEADKAALRKQAATAQKEMTDLANQIKANKARGRDTTALESQYAKAKATYDSLTEQINAVNLVAATKQALKQQTYDEYSKEMEAENKTYSAAQRAAAADQAAGNAYTTTQTSAPEKYQQIQERLLAKEAQAPTKAEQALLKAEQEYNTIPQTSAQSKTGSARAATQALNTEYSKAYRNVLLEKAMSQNPDYVEGSEVDTLRGGFGGGRSGIVYTDNDQTRYERATTQSSALEKQQALKNSIARRQNDLSYSQKVAVTQKRMNDLAQQIQAGRYRGEDTTAEETEYAALADYLETVEQAEEQRIAEQKAEEERQKAAEESRRANVLRQQKENEERKKEQDKIARARTRIAQLGIEDLLREYYDSEGDRQKRLRTTLDVKGVTPQELTDWRLMFYSDNAQFLSNAGTALFQGGMQQFQAGVEGSLAAAEKTALKLGAGKAAAWIIEDLMKAVPDGEFKNSMLDVATGLRENTGYSSHEESADELRQQLSQTMQDTTKNHSGAAKWAIEQMPSMGNMMLGAGTSGALGISNLATLGTTAGGSAYMDAVEDGASHEQALAYGIATGALEAASEKLFGGNPLVDTDAGWVNKLVSKATKNQTILKILDSKGFDLLSEGLEEVITEITEPWAQALIYAGEDADFATGESILNAFLGGIFMAAIGNVAALPGEIASKEAINAATESAYAQATQGADAQTLQELIDIRSKIATGETLTAEDLGKVLEVASKVGKTISPEQVAQDIVQVRETFNSKGKSRYQIMDGGNAYNDPLYTDKQYFSKQQAQAVANAINAKRNSATQQNGTADVLDTAIQQAFQGDTTPAQAAQATNTQTAQTVQPTQNVGAQDVITGAEADKIGSETYTKDDGREIVKQLRRNIPELSGESSVAQLSGNEFQKGTRKLTEQVGDFFRSLGNKVFRQGLGNVILDERGVKSDIGHGIGRAKAITFAAVPDVIENGKQIDFQQNWKGRGYDTYVFAAPVDIGDNRTYVAAVVRSDAQNRLYLHEVVDGNGNLIYKHENAPTAIKTGVTTARGVTGTVEASESFPATTVPQSGQTVKQNVSANNDMGAMRSQFDSQRKQSRTQSNTINAFEEQQNVPEAQRTPLYYDTTTEKQSLNNARMRLAQDYAGEVAELRGKHNWSGEEVDMGMMILDNYRRAAEETGDWAEYSKWRKESQSHGTEIAKALQAYAKWSRQTGGGIVADASAALEKAAKNTNKAEVMNRVSELANRYDTAIGRGKSNVEVNVDDLVQIIKDASTTRQTGTLVGNKTPAIVNWAMNRIANYARAEAQSGGGKNLDFLKAFAADSIYNIAADTNKASVTSKIKETRRLGMLSKVSTVMRNLVSNNVFDPIDSIARNMSIPLDMILSKFTGTRSVALDMSWLSKAKWKGSMDGLARACMEVGLDVNTSGGQGRYENTTNRTFKMSDGVFSKLMSTWEAYEGYTLNATDEFQKGGIEAAVQQNIDKLYEKGKIKDDSLRDAGKQEALYRTYQDETVLSDTAIGIRNALNKAHVGDIGLGDVVLPFAQVPSNLGARAIEYSPAGLLVAAHDFVNMIDSASKGEMTAAQQAKAVQGVGRALTGSAMIAIAAAGALRGWINVAGDDDDDDKAKLDKNAGLDGTQLNISAALRDLRGESAEWQAGDKLISIGFLDPINAQLTTGALIADDIREDNLTAGRVLGNSFSGALQSVLDMPVMETFQDIATSYKYSDGETAGEKILDTAAQYAAGQVSSLIPNSLRGIAQGLDDTERDAYTSDSYWQQAVDNVKASIPGLRETLPAKTDSWGNVVKNEGGIRNFMNRNINPGNVTTYTPDEVSGELEAISKATGESLYPDRSAPKSITVDNQKITLSYEQRNAYKTAYGSDYYKTVQNLIKDSNYQSLPDNVKAEVLKQAESVATAQAKEMLGIGYEMQNSDREISELSGTERVNALIAKAVKAVDYLSEDNQKALSEVEAQYSGSDYVGLSDELFDSAKEKANEYFEAVEAAKYGAELSKTQKELADMNSEELAKYFMNEAIDSRFEDTNKSGDRYDEVLDAYNSGEINDTAALAFLPDDTSENYRRYSQKVGVTTSELLEAQHVRAGLLEKTDSDGKVTQSVQDQFDTWLGTKTNWSDAKKEAIRNTFWPDHTTTYTYLSQQVRAGEISVSAAKSELTPTYQAGWSHNVKSTGASMPDYLTSIVEYENRPSEDERTELGYGSVWAWFCDYLNTTKLTKEQKYAIAISMSDYTDKTKQKIYDRLK